MFCEFLEYLLTTRGRDLQLSFGNCFLHGYIVISVAKHGLKTNLLTLQPILQFCNHKVQQIILEFLIFTDKKDFKKNIKTLSLYWRRGLWAMKGETYFKSWYILSLAWFGTRPTERKLRLDGLCCTNTHNKHVWFWYIEQYNSTQHHLDRLEKKHKKYGIRLMFITSSRILIN